MSCSGLFIEITLDRIHDLSAAAITDRNIYFDTIIAEILSASGRDAGVSVNTGGGDNSTLAGRLKYTVSYQTLDNSGDIVVLPCGAKATPLR